MSCFELPAQVTNSIERSALWTNTVHLDSIAVRLLLTKRPYQIKITLEGEAVAPGRGVVTIMDHGDLLELSAERLSTNQIKSESKTVWNHFHWFPEFTVQQDAVVDFLPIKDESKLFLMLSGDFAKAPSVYMVDINKAVGARDENLLLTNKYQFDHNDFLLNRSLFSLDQFEKWNRFLKGGGGLASASSRDGVYTLTVTNAAGSKFTFSNPDGQWHAYSFWGEIKRVK